MKRFLSILLAVVMIISVATPVFAYTDTDKSDYNEAIQYLSGLGVIDGYNDGSFKPEKVVTRAEMAKLLVVSLGLDAGASLLTTTTSYEDVTTEHWAVGYINVATQYGLIKGDGNGKFRPDDTVNYAEACTMCLRALGYNRVVDKAGQWPTNYLNKANELKLFNKVEDFKGTDGANRGAVAQLMWNMMDTLLWQVVGENETDGLNYGTKAGETMLEVKFDGFDYGKVVYNGFSVSEDDEEWVVDIRLGADDFEYAKNDFYKMVPGMEVKALTYSDDDTDEVVVMFPADENVLVEGNARELEEKYNDYTMGADAAYAFLLLDSNKKTADVKAKIEILTNDNDVVEEIKTTKASTKYSFENGTPAIRMTENDSEFDQGLVMKDGERKTISSLKEDDVVTNYGASLGSTDVWFSTDKSEEGTFEAYVLEESATDTKEYITVGGKNYNIDINNDDLTIVTVDKNEEEDELTLTERNSFFAEKKAENDYVGKSATLFFNAFGEIVKIAFNEEVSVIAKDSFYLVKDGNVGTSTKGDSIVLINKDGEKEYLFANKYYSLLADKPADFDADSTKYFVNNNCEYKKAVAAATWALNTYYEEIEYKTTKLVLTAGKMYWVDFNDDNEIVAVVEMTDGEKVFNYNKDNDDYIIEIATSELGNSTSQKDNYIGANGTEYRLNSDIVTYVYTEKLDNNVGTGKYTLVATTGTTEIKNVAPANILLAIDKNDKVKFAFVKDNGTTDNLFGLVTKVSTSYITIDGTKYEINSGTANAGEFVVYTLKDEKVSIVANYSATDMLDKTGPTYDFRVDDVDGIEATLENGTSYYTDEFEDDYEDYKVYFVEANYNNGTAYFEEVSEIKLAEVQSKIKEDQTLFIDATNEVIVITTGLEF